MAAVGGADYRGGALNRLEEAGVLLRQDLFGGSIYLAGRAVEGMLRAIIWFSDPNMPWEESRWIPATICGKS